MSDYGLNHLGQTSNISTLLFAQDILVLLLEAKSSQQAAAQPFAQRHCCLPYHISDVSLLSLPIIKPGLRPSSKLLFGDKSILQSRGDYSGPDGHLPHCNRPPFPCLLVTIYPLTDVEQHQTR